jgi:nucleotide-binding universal stress UspA family protein
MKKLLVAFDGSDSATRALRHAIEQVKGTGRSIHLLITHTGPFYYPEIGVNISHDDLMAAADRESAKLLIPAEKELEKAGVSYTKEVLCGTASTLIAERAKATEFAGIVMGTRGMGAIKGLIVGSVANQVVHLAEVPVTLVK